MSEHTPLTEAEVDRLDYAYFATDCNFEDVVETVERILAERAFAARTSTATADTGLRERVEALVTEWESTVYKLAAGYPLTTDEFVTFWFKQPLRAILDATAAPTTDTGARDE